MNYFYSLFKYFLSKLLMNENNKYNFTNQINIENSKVNILRSERTNILLMSYKIYRITNSYYFFLALNLPVNCFTIVLKYGKMEVR